MSSSPNGEAADKASGVQHHPPHQAVGFWHPHLNKVRTHVFVLWARTVLILVVAILAVLSLYWAVLFDVEQNLDSLVVYVVDFDGQHSPGAGINPVVGQHVRQVIDEILISPAPSLGYVVIDPEDFAGDPFAVRQAVYDWDAWAAITVDPNATTLLKQAVDTGYSSYDPAAALEMTIQTARDQSTTAEYIVPQLEEFSRRFSASFGPVWAQMVMSNNSLSRDNLAAASAAVNPGITPLIYDLRPFGPATATPAVSIGLIYLIIMAFFSFSFFLPIHMKYIQPQGHPPLHFYQLIIWRWVATVTAYFFISLVYSLISLAFQVQFSAPPASPIEAPPIGGATAYGRGSFPVFWMLNFVGMIALGLACENVAMIVGMPWTALWLIFWVITNVSTSFYSLDLAPGFYQWGYAWPLHQIVEASRQILFDLHSRIGLNFGILFAWAAVGTALFPFCCYFMRWKTERGKRRAEREKDRYVVHDGEGQREVPKELGADPPVRKRGFMRGV